jgi:hypothetical protein
LGEWEEENVGVIERTNPASFNTNPNTLSSSTKVIILFLFLFQSNFKKNWVSLAFPELQILAQYVFCLVRHYLMTFTSLSLVGWRRTLLHAGKCLSHSLRSFHKPANRTLWRTQTRGPMAGWS